jgi:DNA-directed RNA polymerase subunit RPC12/RpoP
MVALKMRRILRKQKSAYALSLVLCLLGVAALLVVLWKAYPKISSSADPFSTFLSLLWTEELTVFSWFSFKLIYLVVLGDALLIAGFLLWVLSRQWFVVPSETVWFQCPFCKKKWKSTGDKALVHCPYCRQLVHPRIAEK